MRKNWKPWVVAIAVLVSLALIAGCGPSQTTSAPTTPRQTTAAPSQTTKESPTTAKGQTTTAPPKTTPATTAAPPPEFTIFMSNSGINVPESVDPANNPYINKIMEMANVKITKVTIPPYADFATRLTTMLSSNEIADLVHNYQTGDINKAGADGAFLEVSKIIADSPVLSKIYTPAVLNAMRHSDDKIYHIRATAPPDPGCMCIRYDLVKAVNDGKYPETVDEFYGFLKKVKEKYPDSVPFSDDTRFSALVLLLKPFGISGMPSWQYANNTYTHAFETPHAKEAVEYIKKLYDEGLMSKTFVTNTMTDYGNQRMNQNVAAWSNNLASCSGVFFASGAIENHGALLVPRPHLKPVAGDVPATIANSRISALNWAHNVAINSKTKSLDGIVRFVEVLLSEEVAGLFVYGIEGEDYTLVNGVKTATVKAGDPDHAFRLIYGFMQGYNSRASIDNRINVGLARLNQSVAVKEDLRKHIVDGTEAVYAASRPLPQLDAGDFVKLSDEFVNKRKTANEEAKSIFLKAIVGEISLAEYDAQVSNFLKTYQPITVELNRVLAEVKTKYNLK